MKWRRRRRKKKESMKMPTSYKTSMSRSQSARRNGSDIPRFSNSSSTRMISTLRKTRPSASTRKSGTTNAAGLQPRQSNINTRNSGYKLEKKAPTVPSKAVFPFPRVETIGDATCNSVCGSCSCPPLTTTCPSAQFIGTTGAEVEPTPSPMHARRESSPTVAGLAYSNGDGDAFWGLRAPGNYRPASSPVPESSGGPGVGGDMRSPLRRNVVSMFPETLEGVEIGLVSPEDRESCYADIESGPLPPPGAFVSVENLSCVSEETGNDTSLGLPGLSPAPVCKEGSISLLSWSFTSSRESASLG